MIEQVGRMLERRPLMAKEKAAAATAAEDVPAAPIAGKKARRRSRKSKPSAEPEESELVGMVEKNKGEQLRLRRVVWHGCHRLDLRLFRRIGGPGSTEYTHTAAGVGLTKGQWLQVLWAVLKFFAARDLPPDPPETEEKAQGAASEG